MTSEPGPLGELDKLSQASRVITIGTFDGVHVGHQALIRSAVERAKALGLSMAVITFDPVPMAVLSPERFGGNILSVARKVDLLMGFGADEVVVLPFTASLAAVTAADFFDALVERVGVRELFIGEQFALGHNREGTADVLSRLGVKRSVRVEALRRVEQDGDVVSSSGVRQAIRDGDVNGAGHMLGRYFRIEGEVIHGAHVGRTIGYPTANVLPPEGQVQLPDGIYASLGSLAGKTRPLPSMTYIGTRPALNTGRRLIETHILDFEGDLYGQLISVDFVERLRADADFPSLAELVAQLQRDEAQTRHVLDAVGPYTG